MKRIILGLAAALVLLGALTVPENASANSDTGAQTLLQLPSSAMSGGLLQSLGLPEATPTQSACCKICTVGKACGDTCIEKRDVCHQPPGCACNG